jgi:REP element-mobilizing transposase RayT
LPAGQRHTPHRARPKHKAAHPVHVTLRASLRSLRSQHVVRTVLGALRDSRREGFRIVHYSIQPNHLHLILEAESAQLLSSGVRGIMVRIARRVNKLLSRAGRLWADRWHGHALNTPREVRNTLRYVLQNHLKHRSTNTPLDPLSSAQWFNGFVPPIPLAFRSVGPPCIAAPRTWLLRKGWERHGKIRISEGPKSWRTRACGLPIGRPV